MCFISFFTIYSALTTPTLHKITRAVNLLEDFGAENLNFSCNFLAPHTLSQFTTNNQVVLVLHIHNMNEQASTTKRKRTPLTEKQRQEKNKQLKESRKRQKSQLRFSKFLQHFSANLTKHQ